jgi:hypothetical protein
MPDDPKPLDDLVIAGRIIIEKAQKISEKQQKIVDELVNDPTPPEETSEPTDGKDEQNPSSTS